MLAAAFNRIETAKYLLGAGADKLKTNGVVKSPSNIDSYNPNGGGGGGGLIHPSFKVSTLKKSSKIPEPFSCRVELLILIF